MEPSHEVVNYRLAKIAIFNVVGYGYDAVPFMNPRIVFDALGGTIFTYEVEMERRSRSGSSSIAESI